MGILLIIYVVTVVMAATVWAVSIFNDQKRIGFTDLLLAPGISLAPVVNVLFLILFWPVFISGVKKKFK